MSGEAAALVLADGTVFEGESFGAPGVATGEVVFTTGMTGYQEVLTDPSYCGQLVAMTVPHVGNTGIVPEDDESLDGSPQVAGFLVRDATPVASSWRAKEPLGAYLERSGIVALSGVDTRRLTRHVRDKGAQNGAMGSASKEELLRRAREALPMTGADLVRRVTIREPFAWDEGTPADWASAHQAGAAAGSRHVVAIDLGTKKNILRMLRDSCSRVTVVPATTSAAEILALEPDGVFVSNGPGDPGAVTYAVETLRDLLGKRPIFGICLGHQLLALAAGGRTYKLKFGHRGTNQPVRDLATGRIEITTHNHGFSVDLASLEGRAQTTHVHLNDGTSEGLELPSASAFSVQYHPEAAAGPHDAGYLFARFASRIDAWKRGER